MLAGFYLGQAYLGQGYPGDQSATVYVFANITETTISAAKVTRTIGKTT